jgi:sucrose-6-phosphate hydrolase SacC (GH32 family)
MPTPRPHAHFTPAADWMNDPNGPVFYRDEWHLFYQYQPADSREKHWGHAVSRDLLRWEHLPVALFPDALGAIWSGSCVVDRDDTGGFFGGGDGLVAVFTHHQDTPSGPSQRQSLAYSRDAGRTWTKYAHNPVLAAPDKPDFRDPKVFWHASSGSWVMIVAAGDRAELYRSPDLKTWRFASDFGANRAPGAVWECPDLFALPDGNGGEVWVLLSSFLDRGNFEGQFRPCYAAYFAGTFDGHVFSPSDMNRPAQRLSFGPDDYAPVTFADAPDGRRVLVGWLNHWGYAGNMGTSPWIGQMTLPRELRWQDGALVQSLPPEAESARAWLRVEWRTNGGGVRQARVDDAPAWEVVVPPASSSWRLDARQNGDAIFSLERDAARGVWTMRRGSASLPPRREDKPGRDTFFTAPCEAPAGGGTGAARVVVDACSVEAFCDDGRALFCFQIFPRGSEWELALTDIDAGQETGGRRDV